VNHKTARQRKPISPEICPAYIPDPLPWTALASPLAAAEDALARLDERLGANLGASLLARSVARADDDGAHKQNKRRPFAIAPTSWM
jgi:hypothetical protein